MCPLKADLLSALTQKRLSIFCIFRHCRVSHTKATEPRPTKFCQTLEGFKGLLSTAKILGKFVPKKLRSQPKLTFFTTFFASSSMDNVSLQHETSNWQTKMLVSINVLRKRWPAFRDLWPMTFDPETAEIRSVVVTQPIAIQHFPSLRASHTNATEPRSTKFCQMLDGLTIHHKITWPAGVIQNRRPYVATVIVATCLVTYIFLQRLIVSCCH